MFQIPKGAAARDAMSAIIILVVCGIGIQQTTQYPARAAQWPLWMWGLLAALSVVLLFNSLRRPTADKAKPASSDAESARPPASGGLRIAINIGLIIGLVVLISILGFYTATGLYLCIHMYYLGIRPAWKIGAVTVGTLAVFYGLFEVFLGVLVPHGLVF